jgi:hypothetical protein
MSDPPCTLFASYRTPTFPDAGLADENYSNVPLHFQPSLGRSIERIRRR